MVIYSPVLQNNVTTCSNRSVSHSDQVLEDLLFGYNSPNLLGEAGFISCLSKFRTKLDFLVLDDADVDLFIDNRLIRHETYDAWNFIMDVNAKEILHPLAPEIRHMKARVGIFGEPTALLSHRCC